ncbi:MAG TPA: hypothetical protein VM096_08160 [Vicinamibacterales bacterium]|nr:hypothetical protein [Vicinamibacterales bacterium]
MMPTIRMVSLGLAFVALGVPGASAQSMLVDVLQRHGVGVKAGSFDAAFDAFAEPSVPLTPGSFATPLAVLTSAVGDERIDGAYAFGILAGRSGRAASAQELAAAGQALVMMMGSGDRRARIAGARVGGRLFAASFEAAAARPPLPPGMLDALFALLNEDSEIEQLAAMDAIGLLRDASAVASLSERYRYYRERNQRSLAGGALEALARIGDRSTIEIVKQLAGDRWAQGKDATALAVAFARERMLKDGSIAVIQMAVDDKSRGNQARGYLAELGARVP